MAKLKLNPSPTFQRQIKLPLREGGEGDVMLTYKHRSRTEMLEFSQWLREHMAPKFPDLKTTDDGAPIDDIEKQKLVEFVERSIDWETDLVMTFVVGWDLEEPFERDNVRTFVNHNRAFQEVALKDYSEALTRAAAGN